MPEEAEPAMDLRAMAWTKLFSPPGPRCPLLAPRSLDVAPLLIPKAKGQNETDYKRVGNVRLFLVVVAR